MKAFVIADASKRKAKPVGALFWQPDSAHEQGRFSLELASWCTEADLPLSLVFGLSRPARCATAAESEQWVKSRIVPEDRHNIAEVLRSNGLSTYDEISLLAASQGRSSDDDYLVFGVELSTAWEGALARWKAPRGAKQTPPNATHTRADLFLNAVERTHAHYQVEYAIMDVYEHENTAQRLGAHIRAQRIATGLTQVQLAARIGISQVVLSRLETGKSNPTLSLLEEIAYALGKELNVEMK